MGRGQGAQRAAESRRRRKNMAGAAGPATGSGAAGGDGDDSLYPIAVLIDELRNEDVQVLESRPAADAGLAERVVGKGASRPLLWGRPGD